MALVVSVRWAARGWGLKFGLEQPGNSPVLSSANRVAPMTPWCLPTEPPACQFQID